MGGSGKGGGFEREQCRALSLWWSDGTSSDVFWRRRTRSTGMANSVIAGGSVESRNIRFQLGDIIAEDAIGAPFFETFNVELKSGYSKTRSGTRTKNIPWDLLDVIDYSEGLAQNKQRKSSVIFEFWEQTKRDAELSKRIPLLIFKRDYHVPVVCVDRATMALLKLHLGSLPSEVRMLKLCFRLFNKANIDELIFIRGQEFFNWLSPEVVKVIHSKKLSLPLEMEGECLNT